MMMQVTTTTENVNEMDVRIAAATTTAETTTTDPPFTLPVFDVKRRRCRPAAHNRVRRVAASASASASALLLLLAMTGGSRYCRGFSVLPTTPRRLRFGAATATTEPVVRSRRRRHFSDRRPRSYSALDDPPSSRREAPLRVVAAGEADCDAAETATAAKKKRSSSSSSSSAAGEGEGGMISVAAVSSSAVDVPGTRRGTDPRLWRHLVPKPWEDARGWDATVEWDCRDDRTSMLATARQLLPHGAGSFPDEDEAIAGQQLATWMKLFAEFSRAERCRARLAATRGRSASAKCRRWHVDHVPVRWIQSLVGPGCRYVADDSAIDWTRINNLDDDDGETDKLSVGQLNRLLVPDESKKCCRVPEGRAVMLLGNGWREWALRTGRTHAEADLPPAVHRSPTEDVISPWQGRVLLTMDVVE